MQAEFRDREWNSETRKKWHHSGKATHIKTLISFLLEHDSYWFRAFSQLGFETTCSKYGMSIEISNRRQFWTIEDLFSVKDSHWLKATDLT